LYASYTYDGLGRVLTQTGADNTTVSHDYSTAWQDLVTNQRGYKTRYHYDAFQRLIKVEELNASHLLYATTTYEYDTLGNLVQVADDDSNTTTMTYDWLSRKTGMVDPDMGSWSYVYDNNGNLTSQTDAKSQTITMTYDALGRLTAKTYPQGSGMTNVSYSYDSTSGGNYGKGQRTGMTDASGSTSYKYDSWGRLVEEKHTINSVVYTTQFTYDGSSRIVTVTYPTGETVTQDYNGRGFPESLSGSVAGDIVDSVLYNSLGMITEINLNNGVTTSYDYWGIDETGGYYGRLWNINTTDGATDFIDIEYTWDAAGNLVTREDIIAEETESFTYDFLDRLTGVSGPYSESFTYDEIGNITSRNGVDYNYDSTQPHAVDSIDGFSSYTYDANGNMTTRGSQTIDWDVENRVISVSDNGTTATFVYDGDGNRVMKTENGETILYVNRYYEKNLDTGVVTTYYYLGGQLVAMREGTDLKYTHDDHLSSTSVMTDDSGDSLGAIKYLPFGGTRSGDVPTDKKFTGQELDSTGLYYYGARYYDPLIGRFISPDTIIPNPANPRFFNRYSYCLNNPLKYIDPSGRIVTIGGVNLKDIDEAVNSGDYMRMLEIARTIGEDMDLLIAYGELRQVAPELTSYVENEDPIVNISSISNPRYLAEYRGDSNGGPLVLAEGISEFLGLDYLTGILAHELFHAAIRIGTGSNDKFAANEAFAYSIQYAVLQKLGYKGPWYTGDEFGDINPWIPMEVLQPRLEKAAVRLAEISNAYTKGWWFWRSPLDVWSDSDPNGDRFLDVAKDVWIQ
jgi:RHS repeat-associated protein